MPVDRRDQIMATAAVLFARDGYHGVSVNDLGAACGITGPAIYKHFRGKQAILSTMLLNISDELLSEGRRRVREADDHRQALEALVDWHATFALTNQAIIVVQDRDWSALPVESREKVRDTQRKYVELWVKVLRSIHEGLAPKPARAMAHAAFGLINSTPHSALLPEDQMHPVLVRMALGALLA
jgi:AcrR family transcriptional regulator